MSLLTIFTKVVLTSWIVFLLSLIPIKMYDADLCKMEQDYGKFITAVIGIIFLISIALAVGGGAIALILWIWR